MSQYAGHHLTASIYTLSCFPKSKPYDFGIYSTHSAYDIPVCFAVTPGSTYAEIEAPSKAAKVSLVVVGGGTVELARDMASLQTVPVLSFKPLRNLAMVSCWWRRLASPAGWPLGALPFRLLLLGSWSRLSLSAFIVRASGTEARNCFLSRPE